MKIVLIDNYDSFTYNLEQYLREMEGLQLTIVKNDLFRLKDFDVFDKIVISPGPGLPESNGLILQTISHFSGQKPILGICLGLQAIYESFGGKLLNLPTVHHGVSSNVFVTDHSDPLFTGIQSPFRAGRYHSWVCDPEMLPPDLYITATDMEGQIMSCRHRSHPTCGVQFHPESILTPEGKQMMKNFVERY